MVALSHIKDPSDIRPLSVEECEELADDIRAKIIQTVAQTGGHLASNLGAVEITLALHRVFDTPRDKIIFVVGHQCYTHKLLTPDETTSYTAPSISILPEGRSSAVTMPSLPTSIP